MNIEKESIELPNDLVEGLKRVDTSISLLTPAVDRSVAEAAAAHFDARPRAVPATGPSRKLPGAAPRPRRWAIAGTLAASLMAGLFLLRVQQDAGPSLPANDFDGSGVVDILDAFALARTNGGASDATQDEIDALVMQIVSLGGGAP